MTSEETAMQKMREVDKPWAHRLLELDANTRVAGDDLLALVNVLQMSDVNRWPVPGVFPGESGGLRLEWREGRQQTIFEVDDEGVFYAAYFDFASGAEDDIETSIASAAILFLGNHLHGV